MFLCGLFLICIVTSPALSSVVWDEPDEIGSNELSLASLTDRSKRQATALQMIPQEGKCVLPPYPKRGSYTVGGNPDALPGQAYPSVFVNITCNPGFNLENGTDSLYCYDGSWSGVMPKCIRFCKLDKHDSVEYHCFITGSTQNSRNCSSQEPSGTVVKPVCREPIYSYTGILNYMQCIDGNWNYIATCKPECGITTPEGIQLIIGGTSAKRGELPWHAGIYTKTSTPYKQICGGTLISTTTVISAAHCFWSDATKLQSASDYAVAVGKIYRPWNNSHDSDAQTSDVANIKVSPYFQGPGTNFQDDIALVIVSNPFTYKLFIRPVCVDFDVNFDRQQLSNTNLGKIAGWGLVAQNGNASQVLKVVELPYVSIQECYALSPPNFRSFITNDKIYAGYTNGTALCQGDSGGGLAFPATERGTQRYYLRGVVSTAPRNEDLCNANTLTTFTRIIKHEQFIKEFSQFSSGVSIPQGGNCVLPPFPENGSYTMDGNANALPGQTYNSAALYISCNTDFELDNERDSLYCFEGTWFGVMPKCVRFCRLDKHDGTNYFCHSTDSTGLTEDTRICGLRVPTGMTVEPQCKETYDPIVFLDMKCTDTAWNYIAKCEPECGRINPRGLQLIEIDRKLVKRGDMPWYAMIYTKTTYPYTQICGGTLISTTTLISAASCFWSEVEKLLPASQFAVAVGNLFLSWNNEDYPDAQTSDVADIKIPSTFRGSSNNYQDDIAVVTVATPFIYKTFIRPVCVDFNQDFDRHQLRTANLGKIATWNFADEYVNPSESLNVIELPYVRKDECIANSPPRFGKYCITSDRICAGYHNGSALGLNDNGAGLVFTVRDDTRYYLRGVVSITARNVALCNTTTYNSFTRITNHKDFLRQFNIT